MKKWNPFEHGPVIPPKKEDIHCVFILSSDFSTYRILYLKDPEEREYLVDCIDTVVADAKDTENSDITYRPEMGYALIEVNVNGESALQLFSTSALSLSNMFGNELHLEGL